MNSTPNTEFARNTTSDEPDGLLDEYLQTNKSKTEWGWKVKDPSRNIVVFMMYYLTTFGFLAVLLGFSLYNLTTVKEANKEFWVGLLSMIVGVILPSPGSLHQNTLIGKSEKPHVIRNSHSNYIERPTSINNHSDDNNESS